MAISRNRDDLEKDKFRESVSGYTAVNIIGDSASPIPTTLSGSVPLPSGAATEATLASLETKDFATETTLSAISAKFGPLGQALMSASAPVVIASNQSAIPVTDGGGSITVDGTVSATQSGTWNINNVSGTISLPTGAATAANQVTQTTSLQLIDNLVIDQTTSNHGQPGVLVQGVVSGSAPHYSDGEINPVSITTTGDTRVYDEANFLQNITNGGYLANIDSSLFTINGSTSNLNIMATAYSVNNAFATGRGVPAMGEYDDASTDLPSEDRVFMPRITQYRAWHTSPHNPSGTPMFNTNANRGYVQMGDGTNLMPTMDTGFRSGYQRIFDGSGLFNVSQAVVNLGLVGAAAVIQADLAGNLIAISPTGAQYNYVASTDNTGTNAKFLKCLTDGTALTRSADTQYETVAASQTDQIMGATGAAGDFFNRIIVTVGTSATGTCSIKDGSGGASIPITAANTPIGVYCVDLEMVSTGSGGWRVTTGAGATAIGVGRFT